MSRLLAENRRTRRIVGQLNSGEDLVSGMLSVCRDRNVRSAAVHAAGTADSLSLSHFQADTRAMGSPQVLQGPLQLLHAEGIVGEKNGKLHLQLNVVASRQGDNGIEVVGGVCVAGRMLACQFTLDAMEDVLIRSKQESKNGLYHWSEMFSAPAAAPAPAPSQGDRATSGAANAAATNASETSFPGTSETENAPGGATWQDAIASSALAEEEPPEEPEFHTLEPGDILDHQQFGRCVVERVDADQEFATVRLRNGRLVRLSLEVLELHFEGTEDNKRVFVSTPAASTN